MQIERRFKIMVLAFLYTQCADAAELNPYKEMSRAEKVWQVAHIIDMGQTIKGPASDRCYEEGNRFTRGALGKKPKVGEVVAFGLVTSYAHAHLGNWLDNSRAPKWLKWTVRAVDFGVKVDTIGHNYSIGIRLGGRNRSQDIGGRSLRHPNAR